MQLKDILEEKCRCNFIQGVLFLPDNAPAHRALATQKKLTYPGFQWSGLDYPPYSPDLAPSDYHMFPGLKKNWKVAIFRPTRRPLLSRRPGWTDKLLNFFLSRLQTFGLRSVLSFVGIMLNKSRVWSLYIVSFLVGLRTNYLPFFHRGRPGSFLGQSVGDLWWTRL